MIDKIGFTFLVIKMKNEEEHNYWIGDWKDLRGHLEDIMAKFDDKEDTISLSRVLDPRQETFLEKNDIKRITIELADQ